MTTEETIEYLTRCADGLDPEFDCAVSMAVSALRAQQAGGWISVNDRLPETDRDFLCVYKFRDNGKHFIGILAYFATDERPHWQNQGFRELTVTHWQPLPEPPKGE